MIDILIFSLIGVGLGIATGLLPGLHINNMLPVLLPLAVIIGPYNLAAVIISMAVVQNFVSFIPSIFLGAPDADTALSTLPGHRLLHEGRGFEAIKLTIVGGVGALAVSILLTISLSKYFPMLYELSRPYIQYALLGIVGFMVITEESLKRIASAILIILLSGILGFLVLQSSLIPQQNALFPMLAGLFGVSILATSMMQKSKIPEQSGESDIRSKRIDLIKSIALGAVAGMIVGFLPAVGVSQAAAIFQSIGGLSEARTFLVSLAGINVANEVFSLNSVYLIGNPRSGASVAIENIFGTLEWGDILLFIGIIAFSAGIGAVASLILGKSVPRLLMRIDYRILSLSVIAMMVAMMFVFTGIYGLLVGAVASAIGILCNHLGVKKSTCMGVLLVPSIIFFSGLTPSLLTAIGI